MRKCTVNARRTAVIGKALTGAAGAVISIGLAAQAGASPANRNLQHVPDFLAAVRGAGITGTDPAMLGDGYNVCWNLWNRFTFRIVRWPRAWCMTIHS